jgi:hypothetical protein
MTDPTVGIGVFDSDAKLNKALSANITMSNLADSLFGDVVMLGCFCHRSGFSQFLF